MNKLFNYINVYLLALVHGWIGITRNRDFLSRILIGITRPFIIVRLCGPG